VGSGNAKRTFTVGRASDCDIVLADDTVSRRHAELVLVADGQVFVTDCHSTHGTHLIEHGRAAPLHQSVVAPHASIRFGDVTMEVAEILSALRAKYPDVAFPAAAAVRPLEPRHGRTWPSGARLVRCGCGTIKPRGGRCPECGE
jgi:predicted component of type VI protein secretion system